jgi:methyl-accepting chemotaxis protein
VGLAGRRRKSSSRQRDDLTSGNKGDFMRLIRKNYFPNPRLQLRIVLGANVLALASAILIFTLNFDMRSHLESYAAALNLPPAHPFSEAMAQHESLVDRLCWLVAFIQLVFFNVTAIILSHRIAGPLHRLQRHLEKVGEGKEPTDVKFRKGDLYQSVAEACNKVMARLRDCRKAA